MWLHTYYDMNMFHNLIVFTSDHKGSDINCNLDARMSDVVKYCRINLPHTFSSTTTCVSHTSPQLTFPDDVLLRCSHSMTAISLTPSLIEVTVFGGDPHYDPYQQFRDIQSIAATTILTFGELVYCEGVVWVEFVTTSQL